MAEEDPDGPGGTDGGAAGAGGQASELPASGGPAGVSRFRTPLFTAQHSERYARQELIRTYESQTGVNLIVVIDQIFPTNVTYLEELLFDCPVTAHCMSFWRPPVGTAKPQSGWSARVRPGARTSP